MHLLHYLQLISFNMPHSAQGHRQKTNTMKLFACTHRPGHTKSKQAHTWYQRARLQGECVWPLYQRGSARGGRSRGCTCWQVRGARWWAGCSAATGPRGQPNRGIEGRSRSSAAHSSRDLRSLSGHLTRSSKSCLFRVYTQVIYTETSLKALIAERISVRKTKVVSALERHDQEKTCQLQKTFFVLHTASQRETLFE